MKEKKVSTNALHAGHNPKQNQATCAVPIYLSSAYEFENADHAASVFALQTPGYIYTRLNNPTCDTLEQRLAALDGGLGACVFASGTSALFTTILCLMKSADHIVSSSAVYGGTFTMLKARMPRIGIETTFVNSDKAEDFEKAIQPNTKLIFVEALPNPHLNVVEFEKIAEIAHKKGIIFMVDNTVLTPALFRPFDFGADLVLYSLTKFMQGHGTTMGGAVVSNGKFDFKNSGRYPEFTNPDPSYHGLIYADLGPAALLTKLKTEGLRDIGACMNPFAAFETIQGLETLDIRMKKHSENALELAKFLESLEQVAWVNYPGLKSSKYNKLSEKYFPKGQSGLLSFGLKKGYQGAKDFVDNVEIFSLVANLGDVKSILTHPSSMTHQQLTQEQKLAAGVTDDLIRVSVGIEDIEDLKADILQALSKI